MSSARESILGRGAGVERSGPGEVRVRRALLSVSDKAGIVDFARGLEELGVELVSTGGTARELGQAGVGAREIEDFTGFPEMMDGRVKTLHPRLYAGLLALRDNDAHLDAAAEHQIEQVDLVCVNLYPFEQTVARGDASEGEIVENIDIGGPTMIRAAAKNGAFAAVVVDPADYDGLIEELRESEGRLTLDTRRRLQAKAFACTARYDAAIATWFAQHTYEGFPPTWSDAYKKISDLRYGENPHQAAAFYARVGSPTHLLDGVNQLHGKELSFNNLLDLSSARELVEDFDGPACTIVKHNNPCGCATAASAPLAYERAFACDPQSAYGGVIALNRRVDLATAQELSKQFIEVLLAPGFEPEALELLSEKKNVRLLELPHWPEPTHDLEAKPVIGGQLVQTRDVVSETREQMRVLTKRRPSEHEWEAMLFAWRVCRHVRSNAIVIAACAEADGQAASGSATIGIGAGQMSRVDAVRIAVEKAQDSQPALLAGSALASDAYFPFADGPELAIAAGVSAIIQPAGSVRDELVVEAAEKAGIAMVATGVRHFRH
ncbi:MAG TPA: bifunctional phosphoribosylaminoimidazolecarboxamide formyltransferase/IMP cyclohydrolase [Solirubrobacteraceae bacterium]|jgi:phosphoribosylaminoimidazolecarboxamide formyltransferase/IMP cyclohydrolase|nr:bifunctional phosphoribosylaminoimidazolecarboxamide formyltransferase/IMP cyclohydrolase [Solirubrobacteraceae bacterium]